MKIAVLVGGLRFDSQRRIMDGILERALEDDSNVYVFTCDSWTYSTVYYSQGETEVFSLPDFGSYDGVIFHGDTVYDKNVINKVVDKIKQADVPCISLNVKHPGMLYVGMENDSGVYEIVEHLNSVHGAKRFAFIAGPDGNSDSDGRLRSFLKALADNNIQFDKNYIYYGDYHPESGSKAVDYFDGLQGEFPDAIVAANDEMALGAFYELKEKGYRVPENVLLTGFDHAFVGKNHYPKITTVERPETELGRRAYEKLKDYICNGEPGGDEVLKSTLVFTESCGCKDRLPQNEMDFRSKIIRDKLHVISYSEIIKSSSADFTGAPTYEQLLVEIRRYIKIIDPEEFYMCMCVVKEPLSVDGTFHITENVKLTGLTEYSPQICIPVAYRHGEFESYGRFEVEKLLPEKYTAEGNGKFYTVIPLHYQDRCYGYCVLGNSRLMMDSELFHLFIMNINNALENLRKQNMLNAVVQKLNRMWIYDTLTGVFNRAGFFRFAPKVIGEAIEKNHKLFVLFLDLDGLKSINDRYGHDEGDNFIRSMGNILSQVHGHGELLMRYGGDEFVVLAQNFTEADAENYISRIQVGIENYNAISGKPYRLDASIGYSIVEPCENMDLEDLVESADREMYKVKNEKKRRKEIEERKS
ncbi:MAG: diguanylate cyclase domain-containing protein [Suilimivivens sp.]